MYIYAIKSHFHILLDLINILHLLKKLTKISKMSKITTKDELERTHLRFLKVQDNKKLSEILNKLLPNMVAVHFESDLEGVVMA